MSQREVLIVLAHAHGCAACRDRLLNDAASVLRGRALSAAEKETLSALKLDDFMTPELLSHAARVSAAELEQYRDHPVARLRHFNP